MSEKFLQPDAEMIESFLIFTEQWRRHGAENCFFEVRCLGENKNPVIQKFSYKKIPDAVKFAKVRNDQKYNIYATINPIILILKRTPATKT